MYYNTETQNVFRQVIWGLQKSERNTQPDCVIVRGSGEDKGG
jgi:hypothetical protein